MLALMSVNDESGAMGSWFDRGIRVSSEPRHIAVSSFPRCLPLRPIWPGFALNTLVYSAILWGAWLLFAALRRRGRRGKDNSGLHATSG
ncbi:hypothetical protein D3C83_100970 [compost metagenome]